MTEAISPSEIDSASPTRIFLEVGVGNNPYIATGERKLGPNDHYIGIDKRDIAYEYSPLPGPEKMITEIDHPENATFLKATGEALPFRSDSVDEIFMGNVMSVLYKHPDGRVQLLREAARTLKSGGLLTIKEDWVPSQASNPELLQKQLIEEGFESIRKVDGGEEEYAKLSETYPNWTNDPIRQDNYFLIARRAEPAPKKESRRTLRSILRRNR